LQQERVYLAEKEVQQLRLGQTVDLEMERNLHERSVSSLLLAQTTIGSWSSKISLVSSLRNNMSWILARPISFEEKKF
jgi:hypothetical protein